MPGLTEKASGFPLEPNAAVERAHKAWEESMLRQIDELRAIVQRDQPTALAHRCGADLLENELCLSYWGQPVGIAWPTLEARFLPDGPTCSIFDISLLLYYLKIADGAPLADRWISFRELPGGAFYNQAFQGYSGDRLAQALGEQVQVFEAAAQNLGGWRLSGLAEYAFAFQPLPRLRLAAVFWPGDEEFPSRATVLFDAASSHYMTTDGMAILGSGLVSRIIKNFRF